MSDTTTRVRRGDFTVHVNSSRIYVTRKGERHQYYRGGHATRTPSGYWIVSSYGQPMDVAATARDAIDMLERNVIAQHTD
ncbi:MULTISPECIES: hypothetical protein [unclassified Bradyrhizobium]|uniref:hypothetical protein n=1 Tax=unclassified Bradyrhizobium TaxID=2631580 RepID=UPI002916BCDC|nr:MULTISPECIES: hypothetical protein [unclassified Bradyrhizobium]